MAAGEAFTSAQRLQIDRAIRDAEMVCRFEFSVFDGLQNDIIVGFVNTQDTIAIALGAFDQSTVNVTNVGGNTFVSYGDGLSTLQLSGVILAEVDIVFSFS